MTNGAFKTCAHIRMVKHPAIHFVPPLGHGLEKRNQVVATIQGKDTKNSSHEQASDDVANRLSRLALHGLASS